MATSVRYCLLSADIARTVASYQCGIYLDMRPLTALRKPLMTSYNLDKSFAPLVQLLRPWFRDHLRSRIDLLFACTRHTMRSVVVMYAIYEGDVPLLEYIHSHVFSLLNCGEFLVDLAAWAGHDSVVEFLLDIQHPGYTFHASFLACRGGHLDVVRYLDESNLPFTRQCLDVAAGQGHLDVVRFLHSNRAEGCSTNAMDQAAANGHFDVVQFLHAQRREGCTEFAMDDAAANGHFEIVQFLHSERKEGCTDRAQCGAAEGGHLDILCFLHTHRTEGCAPYALDDAASHGHLDVVEWLYGAYHMAITTTAIEAAASHGHFDIVKFLVNHMETDVVTDDALLSSVMTPPIFKLLFRAKYKQLYYVMPPSVMEAIVRANQLELVRFVHEEKSRRLHCFTKRTLDVALECGHWNIAMFLHAHRREGCTTAAMDAAAAKGHLSIVEFLHHNRTEGCTTRAMDMAATHGHLDIVRFLHHHRTEGATVLAIDGAAANGHFEIVKFLLIHRQEGATEQAMAGAVSNGYLNIVKFLHVHQAKACTSSAFALAAARGHLEVVKFLTLHHDHLRTSTAMDEAAEHGHLDVVQFLHAQPDARCSSQAKFCAAINGHMDIVTFFLRECTHWNSSYGVIRAMEGAAANGHLHVVEWFVRHLGQCSSMTWDKAAEAGHLNILVMLETHRLGMSYNPHYAAQSRDLDVIRWIDDKKTEQSNNIGFERKYWLTDTLHIAFKHGELDMAKWALVHFGDADLVVPHEWLLYADEVPVLRDYWRLRQEVTGGDAIPDVANGDVDLEHLHGFEPDDAVEEEQSMWGEEAHGIEEADMDVDLGEERSMWIEM
ncbi:hypothetical protein DYB32_008005 [Aphanomyces invadans]|uniref:Uncharacterized protein n=1 Tax=Aphanomyces invadans TaxID=157072 RepID=A0A418AM61_9STRA|nr:hypothetical protein DYB32_008005 [Aphanomyces invadans]